MATQPSIEIFDVCQKYKSSPENTLTNISLQIHQNNVFGLLGPNGAGKTTLISILCGIIPATSGRVSFFKEGRIVNDEEKRHLIGFVPQEYAFYQELTPRQNLDYFGAMYDIPKKELEIRREELLEVLGLSKAADKKVETFSGGMKRRVNLAIGIIHKPGILFLDEPTVGVDVQSKNAIIRYLQQINKQGTTIVYTSHHMSEAEEFCDRIALIDHGRVIAEGELERLKTEQKVNDLQSLFILLTGEEYRD